MEAVVLVLHLMIAAGLVGVVLLQRSEGGALGMGGGPSGFMTGRGTANLLTRMTAGLAAAFFATSIILTLLAKKGGDAPSPLDSIRSTPSGTTAPAAPGSETKDATPKAGGDILKLDQGKSALPKVPKSE